MGKIKSLGLKPTQYHAVKIVEVEEMEKWRQDLTDLINWRLIDGLAWNKQE